MTLAFHCGICAWLAAGYPVLVQQKGPASLSVAGDVSNGQIEISLADLLHVMVRVEGPKGLDVEPPAPITRSTKWKIVRGEEPVRSRFDDGRETWQWSLTFEPLMPGDNPLPLEPFHYRFPDGKSQTAAWEPLRVKVSSVVRTPALKELRDPTDIEEVSRPETGLDAVKIAVAVGALAVILGVAWRRRRRRRRSTTATAPTEAALRDLARLVALGLPEKGHIYRFHVLLANVVRRFLEKTIHVPARRQTTPEFLEWLAHSTELTEEDQAFLSDFLSHCDLAKFAAAPVTPEECARLAGEVRVWLDKSK